MTNNRIDPLFNNPTADKKAVVSKITVESSLVSASEKPPLSPSSKQPMQLVEGAYGNKTFKMWIDSQNRLAIPVKELK